MTGSEDIAKAAQLARQLALLCGGSTLRALPLRVREHVGKLWVGRLWAARHSCLQAHEHPRVIELRAAHPSDDAAAKAAYSAHFSDHCCRRPGLQPQKAHRVLTESSQGAPAALIHRSLPGPLQPLANRKAVLATRLKASWMGGERAATAALSLLPAVLPSAMHSSPVDCCRLSQLAWKVSPCVTLNCPRPRACCGNGCCGY